MVEKNKERLEKKSADYAAMVNYWQDAIDFMSGEETVILAANRYLPRYPDETRDEYNFRLEYAKLTNVFRDVVEGLANKPFERSVTIEPAVAETDPINQIAEDVDGSGTNITVFAMDVFFNGIANAVDFIMVDYPSVPRQFDANGQPIALSQADEKALGIRPVWSRLSPLNIYEITTKMIKGKELVDYVRLFEPEKGNQPKQIREMIHDEATGVAQWIVWKWNKEAEDYLLDSQGVFSIGIIPIVPLHLGRRKGKTFQYYPPMKDALSLQKKLYRSESNLEVTKVFTAYPMLVAKGMKPENDANGKPKRLIRGPGITLYAPFNGQGSQTDWAYLEPSGASLTFLQSDVDKTMQACREIGKQPLTVSSGNLTTITTAVAAGKAKSAVKAWTIGLSDALTNALYLTCLWLGVESAYKAYVFDEFDEFTEPGQDLQALQFAVQNNYISVDTYNNELVRRKVLSADFDPEAERKKLLDEMPSDGGIDNQPVTST